MSTFPPITKTQFLAAFKTCDKYLKSNYIEQETFFHNIIVAFAAGLKNTMGQKKLILENFDPSAFKVMVIKLLQTFGAERWRHFENMSKKMLSEAESHFLAAGGDVLGVALGGAADCAIKGVTKKGTTALMKKAGRESAQKGARKAGQKAGQKGLQKVEYKYTETNKFLPGKNTRAQKGNTRVFETVGSSKGNRLEVLVTGESKATVKSSKSFLGTDLLHPTNGNFRKDFHLMFANPVSVVAGRALGELSQVALHERNQEEYFSYGGRNFISDGITDFISPFDEETNEVISGVAAVALDSVTDLAPYIAFWKSAFSTATNLAIGGVLSKSANQIMDYEREGFEATEKYIKTHVYADIEKDMNSMDKKQLFNMCMFATNQLIQQASKLQK